MSVLFAQGLISTKSQAPESIGSTYASGLEDGLKDDG